VRGNNDHGAWSDCVALTETVDFAGCTIHMLHDLGDLGLDPDAAGIQIVISGHSHRPLIKRRNGILFVNPGSAGPRRFRPPISLGIIDIDHGSITPRLIELHS
jgi:uncharacterized protein